MIGGKMMGRGIGHEDGPALFEEGDEGVGGSTAKAGVGVAQGGYQCIDGTLRLGVAESFGSRRA